MGIKEFREMARDITGWRLDSDFEYAMFLVFWLLSPAFFLTFLVIGCLGWIGRKIEMAFRSKMVERGEGS